MKRVGRGLHIQRMVDLTSQVSRVLLRERGFHFLRSHKSFCVSLSVGYLLLVMVVCSGCQTQPKYTGLPRKTSIKNDGLKVLSDVKLAKDHELLVDLENLRDEIATELNLPPQKQQVVVYLFGSEERYRDYMRSAFPQLPPRRAYFVGSSKELAVYTFWGERVQEDLRHEYTHGILHATLKDVPLWLDEGLAEYFELAGKPGQINPEYASRLSQAIASGWEPDMARLERLESVGQMQRSDYQEAWAWVHFMMHDGDDSRAVLLGYLKTLQTQKNAGSLVARLQEDIPSFNVRFASYVATIRMPGEVQQASGKRPVIQHVLGQQPDD